VRGIGPAMLHRNRDWQNRKARHRSSVVETPAHDVRHAGQYVATASSKRKPGQACA
jgi:hypothetical protein